jgi:methylamine--corrinoid protein Co-methyltransferase
MKSTTRLLDILDRSLSGPLCDEQEYDLKFIAEGVAKVVKKYQIEFNKDQILQQDDDMIDRVWQAAVELFEYTGVYHTNTGRRITFTRDEIEANVADAPAEAGTGWGRERRVIRHREVEDPRPPIQAGGPIGTVIREDMYLPVHLSYIKEPLVDLIVAGTFATTHGRPVRSESPLEILAAWEEIDLLGPGTAGEGREGMGILAVENAISEVGHMSAVSRGGFRQSDIGIVAMIGELKVSNGLLEKVTHSLRTSDTLWAFYNPILGGLGGGEEGTAVLLTAGMIACRMVYMTDFHSSAPVHPFLFNTTGPELMRAQSASTAAISRNSHLMTVLSTSPAGGPGTETLLYECLAMGVLGTVTGVSVAQGVRSAVGVVENHVSGLEERFNAEVSHAATGMSREQGDEIVRKALAQYEPLMGAKPVGQPFWEVYDLLRLEPTADWLGTYEKVKEQAIAWGLPLS